MDEKLYQYLRGNQDAEFFANLRQANENKAWAREIGELERTINKLRSKLEEVADERDTERLLFRFVSLENELLAVGNQSKGAAGFRSCLMGADGAELRKLARNLLADAYRRFPGDQNASNFEACMIEIAFRINKIGKGFIVPIDFCTRYADALAKITDQALVQSKEGALAEQIRAAREASRANYNALVKAEVDLVLATQGPAVFSSAENFQVIAEARRSIDAEPVARRSMAIVSWLLRGHDFLFLADVPGAFATQYKEAIAQVSESFLQSGKERKVDEYRSRKRFAALEPAIRSAKEGNNDAAVMIAIKYRDGIDGPKNRTEAIKWFSLAADRDDVTAQNALARIHLGEGSDQVKLEEAERWLTKAAGRAESDLLLELGLRFAEQSANNTFLEEKAIHWLWKAADAGLEGAFLRLGKVYHYGATRVKADVALAYAIYCRGAALGSSECSNRRKLAERDLKGKRKEAEVLVGQVVASGEFLKTVEAYQAGKSAEEAKGGFFRGLAKVFS